MGGPRPGEPPSGPDPARRRARPDHHDSLAGSDRRRHPGTWFVRGLARSDEPRRPSPPSTRHPGSLGIEPLGEVIQAFAPRTDPKTVERIATIASGNPLVLNLLLDLDVLKRDVAVDGRIDTDPATLKRLPSNLRAIYQDLWEQLPDPAKRVVALVSVQGPEFLPGFVEDAAIRLGLHDELMPAFVAVRDRYGWIRAVNDDRYEFAERQRFDVADDVLHEVYTEASLDLIRTAILEHILDRKSSQHWASLDIRTRRIALESHIDLNERLGPEAQRDLSELADSMEQLAALEIDGGDPARAVQLLASARAVRADAGLPLPMADAKAAEELADIALQEASATDKSTDTEAPDPRASRTWTRRDIPPLPDLPPSAVGDLVTEVVHAEGPILAGDVYRTLLESSGAKRQGRLIRASSTAASDQPCAAGSSWRRSRMPEAPRIGASCERPTSPLPR